MTKLSEGRCDKQRCMDAGNLAPHVAAFTRQLSPFGHRA